MNIAHLLAGPLAERASAVALVHGASSARTTFTELDAMAGRMAAVLRADGVGAGDPVLFFAAPSPQLYAALIATWRIGAVATFVEPSAGRAVLNAACNMCAPRALVASPKAQLLRFVSPALRAIPRKYAIGGSVPFTRTLHSTSAVPDSRIESVAPDDLALLTFTSGSTGTPKGALRTHAILRAQLAALTAAIAAEPGEREMVALPIVVLLNLANGVETVLPDADLRRPGSIDAGPVLAQLRTHHVTRLVCSPAFLERLGDAPHAPASFENVQTIVTGGGPVFPDLVQRLAAVAPGASIVSVYGSTEAEPMAHIAQHEVSAHDRRAMEQGSGLLTGSPVAEVALRILRVTHSAITVTGEAEFDALRADVGSAGEIVVSGAHVVQGYWHGLGDAETKIRVNGTVWHRTGDLGRLDERGRLWLLGRMNASCDDAHGTFYPFAVECAARVALGVRRAAAFARNGRRVLVIEDNGAAAITPDAVRRALPWAALDDVCTVRRIPMDRRHNSKVDYPALMRQLP